MLLSANSSLAELLPIKNLKLAYDIFVGGMLSGSIDISANVEPDRYIFESRARSHGLFAFFTKYSVKNKVVGQLNPKGLHPKYYKTWGSWQGKRRIVEINYESFDRLSYKTVPTAAEDDRAPVPAHLIQGTTDPMTAFFVAFFGNSGAKVCDNVLKIFDGRRRYDVYLSEVGRRETKGSMYSGSARVCRARQTILAGASRRIWLPQFARPKWTEFWLASIRPGLPLLPVRIKADLGIMDLVVHLVAIGDQKFSTGETFRPAYHAE